MARFRAYPYAKALLAVVRKEEPGRAEAVAAELDRVAAALKAVPDFHRVLKMTDDLIESRLAILPGQFFLLCQKLVIGQIVV